PERERRETREGLQHVRIARREGAAATPADPEDSERLAAPHHRRDHRARETAVCRVRDRIRRSLVFRGDYGPSAAQRLARDALLGRELEADELLRQAVDGGASQRSTRRVEEVTVGRVDSEELGDLVDELLQHRVEPELARERLRRLQQPGLLLEPAL